MKSAARSEFDGRGRREAAISSADLPVLELPDHFERKLNLTGRGLSGGKKSGALNALPFLIEDRKIVGWRRKIRAVENIEDLRSELSVKILGYPHYMVVLENREVQLRQPRPNQDVAA